MIDLSKYDTETLARWACELNAWNYPDDMPNKPKNWEKLIRFYKFNDIRRFFIKTKSSVISPYMRAIKDKIGNKEILRWHHINNLMRTDKQFEEWWEAREFVTDITI